MLYSSEKNFLFVHVYKILGTSVREALRPYAEAWGANRYLNKAIRFAPGAFTPILGWRATLAADQHLTAQQIRDVMPAQRFDEAYKFGFVRNPWDWQVSLYFYMRQTKVHPQHAFISELPDFETYIRWRVDHEVRLQKGFFYDDTGAKIVDYIGKMETVSQDWPKICAAIGVEAPLGHTNRSNRRSDYRSYYDDHTFGLIADAFKTDIELFGYADEL